MIEDALRAGRKKAPRKRAGEDDLDLLADEEVATLRRQMVNAADDDEEANRLKKPAMHKLKLLPRVVATLQK
jgi:transcription factor SPN1